MEKDQQYNQIKQKGITSAMSLFFQSGYSAVLGLVANLVVTILLSPTIFGMYITVLSIISLLNYFSDIGLAASLIQKKDVEEKDFQTTFSIQQFLIILILCLGYAGTQFVISFYKLPKEGMYLYWALLGGFFFSSLKTIPSILLERKIQFQKIVLVQIIENTVFYLVVIVCAILKFGLSSFTVAVLLRSIVGVIAIYIISPWKPSIGISKNSLRVLLKFGVPFQASSFLALFKDDLIMLFLGKVVGFAGVGYIGWAKKWAEAPIRIIMDNITKVLFPVISRLQQDKERVKQLIEKILFFQTALLAPIIFGMALTMNHVIQIIPKYGKWLPALPLLYLFCFSAFLASFSSPLLNLTNALGKAKIPLFFMTVWTIVTWILTPILTYFFSYLGFALTIAFVSLSSVFVIYQTQTLVGFRFIHTIYKPIISACIMALVIILVKFFLPTHISILIVSIILGVVTYLFSLSFLFRINLIKELRQLCIQ